ncbi:MAG: hypothetical protein KatS3mg103_1059 [Phycisphaerales bacterium]|nr:MAG: hypothetical protein KatS3mg103_1059 [Phycisphaerales bacterium]
MRTHDRLLRVPLVPGLVLPCMPRRAGMAGMPSLPGLSGLLGMVGVLGVVGVLAGLMPSQVLAQAGPSSIIMAEEPVALEEVGLEVQIPQGATAFRTDQGPDAVPTLEISPSLGHWYMLIRAPQRRTAGPEDAQRLVGGELPVDHLTDRILENLLASYREDRPGTEAFESRARVLVREKGLRVAGRPASRFYVAFPEQDRERIRMYTLVDAGAGQMISFDLFCDPQDQAEARLAYLAVLSSARLTGNTQLAAARAVAIETTEALLASLTPSHYRQALALVHQRWDRLSRPAETGLPMDDEELGYRYVRAWEGQRGEINPERSREGWSEEDHQQGYLVRIDGRMAERGPQGGWTLIDSRIICFMSFDRRHEAWTATTTYRVDDRPPVVNSEFGLRDGEKLKVARRGTGATTLDLVAPPRGWLCLAEFYLLPQLLIGRQAEATYGVYAYSIGDTAIRYRQFQLQREQGPAAWRLTTTLGEDEVSAVSMYDAQGNFLGSERGDGTRWTPSSRDQLLDLWQDKGMPTRTQRP